MTHLCMSELLFCAVANDCMLLHFLLTHTAHEYGEVEGSAEPFYDTATGKEEYAEVQEPSTDQPAYEEAPEDEVCVWVGCVCVGVGVVCVCVCGGGVCVCVCVCVSVYGDVCM